MQFIAGHENAYALNGADDGTETLPPISKSNFFPLAARFSDDTARVYKSSVILLFGCLSSSCATFTSTPWTASFVARECLKLCQLIVLPTMALVQGPPE